MKQVLLAVTVIIVVASLAAVGTYASFSDIETSEGNYFRTGSFDLQLKDADEGYGEDPEGESVAQTWDFELQGYAPNGGLDPGEWLVGTVYLKNFGTVEALSLDIGCFTENFDEDGIPTFDGKNTTMLINELTYTYDSTTVPIVWNNGASWAGYIDDEDGDLRITLYDWEEHSICGLTPPAVNSEAELYMMVTFDPPISNPYAGHETIMRLTFALMQ